MNVYSPFLLLLATQCVLCLSPCYLPTQSAGKYWKLIHEDEFTTKKLTNWKIENETLASCTASSCARASNVRTHQGHLLLEVRRNSRRRLFKTATLTSTQYFTYGRIELRLAQPADGQLRTSLFTFSPNDTFGRSNGQIDFATRSTAFPAGLLRGVHFALPGEQYEARDFLLPKDDTTNFHQFHLYGIEWSTEELRFFFDDTFSQPIKLSVDQFPLNPYHKLRLQVGLGEPTGQLNGSEYSQQAKVHWKCPAMIVDYLRIYEKVSVTSAGLELCKEKEGNDDYLFEMCKKVRNSGHALKLEMHFFITAIVVGITLSQMKKNV